MFLDTTGLSHLWNKIKAKFTKVENDINSINSNLANLSLDTLFGGNNIIQASGDVVAAAKTAPHIINFIVTGATTTNLPSSASVLSSSFNYSVGLVFKRATNQFFILLFSYNTAHIAVGSVNGNTWSGWSIK